METGFGMVGFRRCGLRTREVTCNVLVGLG